MKRKTTIFVLLGVLGILILFLIVLSCVSSNHGLQNADASVVEGSSEDTNVYTWEEFEALTADEQDAFYDSFGSREAFEDWMNDARAEMPPEADTTEAELLPQETKPKKEYPWEKAGAKQPAEYTWEEFESLTTDEQDAFCDAFASIKAFEEWRDNACAEMPPETETTEPVTLPQETKPVQTYPWEKPGAKQPAEYTWEEFEALTADEQDAFCDSFGSNESFEEWMIKVGGEIPQPPEDVEPETAPQETKPAQIYPWDAPGAKQPADYSWEEFEDLTLDEKDAFRESFESSEAFEHWMRNAQEEYQSKENL